MNLDRKIRLFFVNYGRLLFIIIAIITAIIYAIQSLNNNVKERNSKKELTQEEKIIIEEQKENDKQARKNISDFIDYCINNDIQKAYDCLSETCKKEKYNTLQEFKNKYINAYFSIKIEEYKIIKEDNSYIVSLTEDMLITGNTESKKKIKITYDSLDQKLYIID